MGSELDIQMKQFNGTDYDNLFPKTKGTLVEGIYTADETLTNDVKGLYGLGANATPDEIFRTIYNKFNLIASNLAQISVTVQTTNGNKLQGIIVNNVFDSDGNPVTTNVNGVATGFVNAGKVDIGVSGFADIIDSTKQIETVKGQTYNETFTLTTKNYLDIFSNRNVKFSSNVQRVDVTVLGGGGSGASTSTTKGAITGGGGGFCVVKNSISFTPNTIYKAVVGKGGAAVEGNSNGKKGGDSSFAGVTASGGGGGELPSVTASDTGKGGKGNGNGGYGTGGIGNFIHATEGKILGYSSFTETIKYGGGGAGIYYQTRPTDYTYYDEVKTTEYGGRYIYGQFDKKNGTNKFGGGGMSDYSKSGKGGDGRIAIRMHLKAT